jgi:hypothetical protein
MCFSSDSHCRPPTETFCWCSKLNLDRISARDSRGADISRIHSGFGWWPPPIMLVCVRSQTGSPYQPQGQVFIEPIINGLAKDPSLFCGLWSLTCGCEHRSAPLSARIIPSKGTGSKRACCAQSSATERAWRGTGTSRSSTPVALVLDNGSEFLLFSHTAIRGIRHESELLAAYSQPRRFLDISTAEASSMAASSTASSGLASIRL